MTLKTKWAQQISTRSLTLDSFDRILPTIEVITNNNLVINSVRVLIVVLALLLGYTHSNQKDHRSQGAQQTEQVEQSVP